nr:hypothetical protein [Tanacetum cinerariifolium]
MLCLIESVDNKVNFFCSFIYASNSNNERRELWSNLMNHKSIAGIHSWTLMGDFNVILKPEEQSNGSSGLTSDMSEFRDAVNSLEIDDLCSSGFNFTWTKSLKNPMTSTLKKLDRILTNEGFMKVYNKSHGVFLPYLIFDHSPVILVFPEGLQKKRSTFRFTNLVADKPEFLDIIKGVWQEEIKKCKMYRVVQKLKSLKKPLRKLSWKNGNIFEKVHKMKLKLAAAQSNLDVDPQTKVSKEWARENKSRVETICKENGSGVDGSEVPDQFVNHLKKILGQSHHVQSPSNMDKYVQTKISHEYDLAMIRMITDEEIKDAIFNIDSSKAAGPNGYTSCFFKKAWSCIWKNEARRCDMKIDIQKAYDTVNWDFLRYSLLLVGFHEVMVNWIVTCISSASFSICINEENIVVAPSFKYHYGCKDIKLTHMCFADDLMIMCNGDRESLKVIKSSLEEFSKASARVEILLDRVAFEGGQGERRGSQYSKSSSILLTFYNVENASGQLSHSNQMNSHACVQGSMKILRYSRFSNADRVHNISHSIYVTNFPDSATSRNLWNACSVYGTVVDVFIPLKKSKVGKRFAFVRFVKVHNLVRLVENLCTIWIGRHHLFANQVRYERPQKNHSNPSVIRKDPIMPFVSPTLIQHGYKTGS